MSKLVTKCRSCRAALHLIGGIDDIMCRECGHSYSIKDYKEIQKEIGKHYGYDYKGIRLDPYRIFSVYHISHPAQQHAIKKLLRAGESVKSLDDDIAEAIATLQRWQQMRAEDEA